MVVLWFILGYHLWKSAARYVLYSKDRVGYITSVMNILDRGLLELGISPIGMESRAVLADIF